MPLKPQVINLHATGQATVHIVIHRDTPLMLTGLKTGHLIKLFQHMVSVYPVEFLPLVEEIDHDFTLGVIAFHNVIRLPHNGKMLIKGHIQAVALHGLVKVNAVKIFSVGDHQVFYSFKGQSFCLLIGNLSHPVLFFPQTTEPYHSMAPDVHMFFLAPIHHFINHFIVLFTPYRLQNPPVGGNTHAVKQISKQFSPFFGTVRKAFGGTAQDKIFSPAHFRYAAPAEKFHHFFSCPEQLF